MRRTLQALGGAAVLATSLFLTGCVAPVGPVEVTRFHATGAIPLGRGTIAVEPAEGQENGMEFGAFSGAVLRELTRAGYSATLPGAGPSQQVALLSVERHTLAPVRNGSPVSVGVGGSTGSYGSGVGVGLGIDLSGPPPAQVETQMRVMIRERDSGRTIWEGRAQFTVSSKSPLAQTSLGAAKMAEALFKDFPGQSGETILVK
ncbi:DUF4136 domain-containing protein [Novosphingobium sp. KN65.2]|uniref:DUF4136 domain-containing protein n=1 Tax=Novosphingobium sp. KN65.2 TaxID=1478134 RepID=UPI0005DD6524|nr:DUF4136 domain-containing protein [Novosphingobium sp. KN65.2]CDO37549.1 conserved exported hypothetical protein [Novosphingobium sp. KN65.2]